MGPGTNHPPRRDSSASEVDRDALDEHEPTTGDNTHDPEKNPSGSRDTSETATLSRTKTQEQIEEEKRDDEIHQLARRYTSQSNRSVYTKNPFEEGKNEDSILNPNSPNFNPRAFAKSLLNLQARDPEKWKARTAGFAFKDLYVYGFGSDTDYQKDVVCLLHFKGLRELLII